MDSPEAPGWYDDPDDADQLRYFDGIIWSDRRVPKRVERPAPAPVGAPSDTGGGAATPHAARPPAPGAGAPPSPAGGQTYPPARPQEVTTADGEPLAPFGSRVGAYLVDSLVVGVLNLVLAGWAAWLWFRPYLELVVDVAESGDQQRLESLTPTDIVALLDWQWYPVFVGISLVVLATYHTLLVGLRGATVGKLLVGLRVRAVDRPGPPGLRTGFMRILLPLGLAVLGNVPLLSYLILPLNVADLLWPARDVRRQAWHDKVAGTQVVQVRR